jgi:hypothetical protein
VSSAPRSLAGATPLIIPHLCQASRGPATTHHPHPPAPTTRLPPPPACRPPACSALAPVTPAPPLPPFAGSSLPARRRLLSEPRKLAQERPPGHPPPQPSTPLRPVPPPFEPVLLSPGRACRHAPAGLPRSSAPPAVLGSSTGGWGHARGRLRPCRGGERVLQATRCPVAPCRSNWPRTDPWTTPQHAHRWRWALRAHRLHPPVPRWPLALPLATGGRCWRCGQALSRCCGGNALRWW